MQITSRKALLQELRDNGTRCYDASSLLRDALNEFAAWSPSVPTWVNKITAKRAAAEQTVGDQRRVAVHRLLARLPPHPYPQLTVVLIDALRKLRIGQAEERAAAIARAAEAKAKAAAAAGERCT